MSEVSWVYITARDEAEAEAIGRKLVESRMAACANIFPGVSSIYRWDGDVVTDREAVLVVKTRTSLLKDVIDAVMASHSEQCPCIVAMPIEGGSDDYIAWLLEQTGQK